MSNPIQPQHRSHSAEEPLPTKAPFDYSAEAMQKVKLPQTEEGDTQFKGSQATTGKACNCARTESGGHESHCHSELHGKRAMESNPPVKVAEGHHFFADGRPRPVGEDERETVEWIGKKKD